MSATIVVELNFGSGALPGRELPPPSMHHLYVPPTMSWLFPPTYKLQSPVYRRGQINIQYSYSSLFLIRAPPLSKPRGLSVDWECWIQLQFHQSLKRTGRVIIPNWRGFRVTLRAEPKSILSCPRSTGPAIRPVVQSWQTPGNYAKRGGSMGVETGKETNQKNEK